LEKDYNSQDKALAFKRALEWGEKIPTGVFYRESRPTLEENLLPEKNMVLAKQPLSIPLGKLLTEFN
jgi:2-oxoglutarate ferredoxin oxidoreductase subunit beta